MTETDAAGAGCSEPDCDMPPELVQGKFCDSHGPGASQTMSKRGRKGAEALQKTLEPGTLTERIDGPADVFDATVYLTDCCAAGLLSESRLRACKKALKVALDAAEVGVAVEEFERVAEKVDDLRDTMERDREVPPWER